MSRAINQYEAGLDGEDYAVSIDVVDAAFVYVSFMGVMTLPVATRIMSGSMQCARDHRVSGLLLHFFSTESLRSDEIHRLRNIFTASGAGVDMRIAYVQENPAMRLVAELSEIAAKKATPNFRRFGAVSEAREWLKWSRVVVAERAHPFKRT